MDSLTTKPRKLALCAAVVLLGSLPCGVMAESKCAHCGAVAPCQKVCRLVCGEQQVEVFCWGCKCEDVCVPGPSCRGCRHCETVCDDCQECAEDCDSSAPYAEPKRFVWFDWLPNFATTYTRTKLMRKSDMVTVPSYKWVVEEVCCDCAARCGEEVVSPNDEVLPPPK